MKTNREEQWEIRRRPSGSTEWGAWYPVSKAAGVKVLQERDQGLTDIIDKASGQPMYRTHVHPHLVEVRVTVPD